MVGHRVSIKAKMKVLITGSSGMLGRALCQALSDKFKVVGMDIIKPMSYVLCPMSFIKCDITDREKTVAEIISLKPDIVIHAAAYTDVDGCERDPQKANAVNALGTQNVARACKTNKCLLIYISTDFVFDGKKASPYIESDQPNPISSYGRSKLKGEEFIHSILTRFAIIRSSWLFGKGGHNFVDIILEKARTEEELKVVNDQRGSPTYTPDLAKAIARLIELSDKIGGIYHITNSGSCCWYEFALAIKEMANLDADILPISSEQFRSPAKRPKMSILDNTRYQQVTSEKLRPWPEALKEYLSDGCKEIKR